MTTFKAQADRIAEDVRGLFNRSLRKALAVAVEQASRETHQDSSNAAFHWLVADANSGRPGARRFGKVRDLRSTDLRAGTPPVGRPRDHRTSEGKTGEIDKVVRAVGARARGTLEKDVAGRTPSRQYVLYHGLSSGNAEGVGNASDYEAHAGITAAGRAGMKAFEEVMEREFNRGNVRKTFKRDD